MRKLVGVFLLLAGVLCLLLFSSGDFVILHGRFVDLHVSVLPLVIGVGAMAAGLIVLLRRHHA